MFALCLSRGVEQRTGDNFHVSHRYMDLGGGSGWVQTGGDSQADAPARFTTARERGCDERTKVLAVARHVFDFYKKATPLHPHAPRRSSGKTRTSFHKPPTAAIRWLLAATAVNGNYHAFQNSPLNCDDQ